MQTDTNAIVIEGTSGSETRSLLHSGVADTNTRYHICITLVATDLRPNGRP
jgi:hypothetical protein